MLYSLTASFQMLSRHSSYLWRLYHILYSAIILSLGFFLTQRNSCTYAGSFHLDSYSIFPFVTHLLCKIADHLFCLYRPRYQYILYLVTGYHQSAHRLKIPTCIIPQFSTPLGWIIYMTWAEFAPCKESYLATLASENMLLLIEPLGGDEDQSSPPRPCLLCHLWFTKDPADSLNCSG